MALSTRDIAQEHAIARAGRRAARQVGGDRIPDVLRKRQTRLVARLARDPRRARLPLDVVEAELRHVAGPQPQARQEQDDRAITPARNAFAPQFANPLRTPNSSKGASRWWLWP
jgi:hypothetical protein